MTLTETVAVPTDLIVLIDTSGSMSGHAEKLSEAADAAITKAKSSCNADLTVEWFGIEGDWRATDSKTKFTKSYRSYLNAKGVDDSKLAKRVGGQNQGDKEDGAAGVIDLAEYFDWRPTALRTIFYLGDEGLAQGDPNNVTDDEMTDRAIAKANEKGVVVYAYCASSDSGLISDYKKFAERTNGVFFGGDANALEQQLEQVFETVISKTITINKKPKETGMQDVLQMSGTWGAYDTLSNDKDYGQLNVTVTNVTRPGTPEATKALNIQVLAELGCEINGWNKPKVDDNTGESLPRTYLQPESNWIEELAPGESKDVHFLIATANARYVPKERTGVNFGFKNGDPHEPTTVDGKDFGVYWIKLRSTYERPAVAPSKEEDNVYFRVQKG